MSLPNRPLSSINPIILQQAELMITRSNASLGADCAPIPAPSHALAVLFRKLSLTAFVAGGLASVAPMMAQSNVDGAITGRASGAGTIVVTEPSTGMSRTAATSAAGTFRISALPPGVYTVAFTDAAGVTQTTYVSVVIGTTSTADFSDEAIALGEMKITDTPVNPIDFGKTTSSTLLSKETVDLLPIARTTTAIALLTPGTVPGDNQFNLIGVGRLASFGGASVAENAYFVDGFNLTNFRNGLGGSTVPFEFYDQFEVINGAYSAEYGRSVGGVINSTTKQGTNEFHGGVRMYYRPDALSSDSPDVYFVDEDLQRQPFIYNGEDYRQKADMTAYLSGPILKDKVFAYAIYNRVDDRTRAVAGSGTRLVSDRIDNPFYGLRLDAVPFQQHRISYTFFSDDETTDRTTYNFDFASKSVLRPALSEQTFERGGKNHIARYTGVFFDDLTVSLLYGTGKFDRSNLSPQGDLPFVQDLRPPYSASAPRTVQGVTSLINAWDEREARRVDLEYAFEALGNHRLGVGYDEENNTTFDQTIYGGGERWRYVTTAPGRRVLGQIVPEGVTELVYKRVYRAGGSFDVKSKAYYIEDNWSLPGERLMLRIGLRNESFENFNAAGESFIKIDDQYAPRLGASYDVFGNQKTKLFANFGRYYLPVATNTNIRLAGCEYDEQTYYFVDAINPSGTNPNGSPLTGAQFATSLVSDGTPHDTSTLVAKNLTPMYQDEYGIGIQHQLSKLWTIGVRGSYRNLGSAFDDAIIDHALNAYAARNGLPDQS